MSDHSRLLRLLSTVRLFVILLMKDVLKLTIERLHFVFWLLFLLACILVD